VFCPKTGPGDDTWSATDPLGNDVSTVGFQESSVPVGNLTLTAYSMPHT